MPGKAKKDLRASNQAENPWFADKALDSFVVKYDTKHAEAAECLVGDRTALLAFYGLPAELPS